VAIACLANSTPCGAAVQATEVIDRVLAIVSGEVITLSDVAAARELGLVSATGTADPVREVLTRLIDRSLMLDEVERYSPPLPSAAAVDEALARVRARFSSNEAFQVALLRVGFTERRLREAVAEDLRVDAYLAQRFTIPPLADGELARYYELHQDEFAKGGRLIPFEEVREEVAGAATEALRKNRIDAWIEGLRRRAEIADLYVTGR
jgi:hypothetical protein